MMKSVECFIMVGCKGSLYIAGAPTASACMHLYISCYDIAVLPLVCWHLKHIISGGLSLSVPALLAISHACLWLCHRRRNSSRGNVMVGAVK
jgi:hypothetical protein